MTRPAENQQTVEALAAKIEQGMSSYMLAPDGAVCLNTNYNAARAALRDLVARAKLVAELRTALEMDEDTFAAVGNWVAGVQEPHAAVLAGIDERIGANRALLARLDGAR